MLSYQLYSSRNFGAAADTVRRMADLGYPAVEGYGALIDDAEARTALAGALKDTGLAMPTAHLGLESLETNADIAGILTDMGAETVYVPHIGPDQRPTDADGWKAFAERVSKAGDALRAKGLRMGWHNHDFEFDALPDGSIPMDHMLTADLDWQFDVAWAVRAGADPMGWIGRYGDRITAAHVKDLAPAGDNADEDGWADPGTGTMDWPAIAKALKTSGAVKHFVVEHDNPSDDTRFAKQAMTLAKAEGLA